MAKPLQDDCFDWSEANVTELKRLYLIGGKSPGQISKLWKHLPNAPTRNAVIGKLRRLGLTGDINGKKRRQDTPKIAAAGPRKWGGHHEVGMKRLAAVTAPAPPMPHTERINLAPVTLEHGKTAAVADLNESMCHFPIGDPQDPSFAYCGRASNNSPYCTDHRRVVYQRRAA